MNKTIAFVHTVTSLAGLFNELTAEILPPEVDVFHIADEMLLNVVLEQGGLSPFIHQRVVDHVVAAERVGADLVQLTCSSISPCADTAAAMTTRPVLKIDAPMVDKALSIGDQIGVAATAPTTLKPTQDLIQRRADELGMEVHLEPMLVEGAYDALFAGDVDRHDQLVRKGVSQLVAENEVVLLAQASMARVVDGMLEDEKTCPILSSPRLAVERLAEWVRENKV